MRITTKTLSFDVREYDNLKIFFDATGLTEAGVKLETYNTPVFGGYETKLCYTFDEDNEEQVNLLMFLAIKHLGMDNMLHDYLNKIRTYRTFY